MDAGDYTAKTLFLLNEADPDALTTKLGRLCIKHEYPVDRICRELGVSKTTVYRWWKGAHPRKHHVQRILELIDRFPKNQ